MKMDVSMMLMNMMRKILISLSDPIQQEICALGAGGDPCMVELLALVTNQGEFSFIHTHH
jgi:hypothetical protein